MASSKRLKEALDNGCKWCVLPPQRGHPMPCIGHRLMKLVKHKINTHSWVCVQLGDKIILQKIADDQNRMDNQIEAPRLPTSILIINALSKKQPTPYD